MTRRRGAIGRVRHGAAAAIIGIVLAGCTTSTAGGGTGSTGSTDAPAPAGADAIASMLALLPPAGPDDLDQIIAVTRWHAAADAYGIEVPGAGATDDEVLDYLIALTVGDGGLASASDLLSLQVAARESTQEQFGYTRQSISAEATSGQPPRLHQAARGQFDPGAITQATKAGPVASDVKETEVDGVPVLRWRDDFTIDVTQVSALSRVGTAGRLALPDDSTLLYATYDQGIEDLIAAQQGGDSLADDPGLAAVAEGLDANDALSALIAPKSGNGGLVYDVAGIGFAWDGQARMILVYSTDSAGDAEALTRELEDLVTTGRTLASNQPWSDYLSDPQIGADGPVVTATFALEGASSRWAQFLYNQENLF